MDDKKEKARIKVVHLLYNKEMLPSPCSLIEQDTKAATMDLVKDSCFQPVGDNNGPYEVTLSVKEGKLIFQIKNENGKDLPMLILSRTPYRHLIKDYYMMVENHYEAAREGRPERIQTIDMGRRGIHNEGAELLIERLGNKIEMDQKTARRIFTLMCALNQSKKYRLL